MSQVTVTVPSAQQVFQLPARMWLVAVVLIAAALAASIVVEVYKRHYSAKKQEELAKHYTALLLTLASSVFTGLGYFLILAANNSSLVSGWPFVEKHFAGVVGIAYLIYNFRLNKWYQRAATYLGKWSKTTPKATPTPVEASTTGSESTFV